MPAADAPVRALGGTVTSHAGWGYPTDELEHIPDLVWPASIPTLHRMRSDPTLQSVLAAYVTPLVAADWRIDPKGADPEAVRICADSLGLPVAGEDAEQIGASRRRGVKWAEHVRLAALHLVFGFCPFEPVYEVRPDGRAYLLALPERLPHTITDVRVNDDGTLKAITQAGQPGKATNSFGGVEIPADRLLWYVHDREGAQWTGRSLLRAAYSSWLLKLDTLRVNAVGINRFGAGTPVMEPLPGTNPTPAQLAEAQRLASAVRVGETGGAVPVGFTLRIKGVEGTLPDALPTLAYYDQQIARSCLTSILDLGNTATGSRALGDNFADMLQRALQSIGDRMAETASQLCVRLTTFNFGEGAVPPVVTCGDVGASKAAIANSITALLTAGAITPDGPLEAFVRDAYHLPPADPTPPAPVAPVAPVALAASGPLTAAGGADAHTGPEAKLVRWFVSGEGAAAIRWGSPGDWQRCLDIAGKHMPPHEAQGFCANRHKEATGEWPGPKAHGVHAAAGDPVTYREATPAEQQAGVDPAQVDQDQDGLVAEGMVLFAAIVAVWGAALAGQITTALGARSLAALARLQVDSTDAAQGLAVLMREAADAGVAQVLSEARRAGVPNVPAPGSVAVDTAALDDAAEAAADLMGQGLARAAGKEAARLAGPEADPKGTARQAVAAAVEAQTPIHDALHAEVARGMGAGRTAAQQAVQLATGLKLIPFASALRDQATCGPCAANDGHEYPDLMASVADFPTGHYAGCLGRSRCRCLVLLKPAQL